MTDTRISLTKQLYNKRFEICQKDVELRKWLHIQFGLDIDAADRWDDLTKQHVINQIDALISEPKLGARKITINYLGSQWVEQQLTAKRMATRTEIDDIWAARRRELTRYFCGCRTSGLSQLTATEGEQFIKWLEYRIKPEGDEPAPAPWVPDPLPITDAVTRTPLIQIPTLMALEASSVQVVALLPAITDTPLVYGCDQFIQVPVEVDAAPAFAGQDNRTQWLAVRVVEVEDDEIEIVFEPDEELNALIQEPVKIPSRLEHVIEMEKKLHATRKARILEIENEVCQFFELERFVFRTTTGKFTSTVIDQQDAETLRGYLVHLESKYDSMKSRQALGDRRESRRLGKTG